ncbi:MAG: endonuclease/exonuclease/phosphatase family protein, partial [Acidimicrobiales bacterium]
MREVGVASFNVHGGVDGLGRRFDVVAACRSLDADVLVLQEVWTPTTGRGLAPEVASGLGYQVEELPLTEARRSSPSSAEAGPTAWGPLLRQRGPHGLRVGAPRSVRPRQRRPTGPRSEHGTW